MTTAKSRRQKYEYEKIYGSPESKLQELAEQHGLTQYRAELKRRWPDGALKGIQTFPSVDAAFIVGMQDWVTNAGLGGGSFEVYIYNNLDPKKVLFMFGFELEGDPIEIKRQPKYDPNNPFGAHPQWGGRPPYQPQQGWGPQVHQPPGPAPYPGPAGWGQPSPWGQAGPWQRPPPPPRDTRLEGEIAELRRRNDMLEKQIIDRQHQDEMRVLREDSARQMREIKNGVDRQIQVLKEELKTSRKPEGESHMTQLFNMFTQSSQRQQDMMQMFMNRESEASREQVKHMKEQMLEDIKFRREMYEKIAESRDPKQAAAMLDLMGQQTASMMNLVRQAVDSGLLGGQEGDPAWYKAVTQGLTSLEKFGQNILTAVQRKQAMAGMGTAVPGGRPRFPAPRPGMGQMPTQRPGPPAPPRPPGQASQQPPSPPAPPPGQSETPQTEVLDAEPDGEEQQPPSLIIPIQRFVMAMQEDYRDPDHKHTRQVADMIYDFVAFLRANEMIPAEWRGFFSDPARTVSDFLKQFVEPVNPEMGSVSDEYLGLLGSEILEIIREESEEDEEEEDEEQEKADETPAPPAEETKADEPRGQQQVLTPPAPPEEEEESQAGTSAGQP